MAYGLNPRQLREREQVLATLLAHYAVWRFVVCCDRCRDGARHVAVSLLAPRHGGATIQQAIAQMRCRVRGGGCGAAPSYIRIEEDGPERAGHLQVMLIGAGATAE